MENKHISELLNTLDSLVLIAGDIIDEATGIKAELEQTFVEIEQVNERRATA
ncbi:MAG: hypothetical protein K2K53_12015 [Oscillospiraceae bacterium]|nr:hypothetical protein [Oscillospiraceae bacterium]